MKYYTIRTYDRKEGKTAHDAILVKCMRAASPEKAVEDVLERHNPLPGDGVYATELPAAAKLTRNLQMLLLTGVKQAGSYDPEAVLSSVEEQMTEAEVKATDQFLGWVFENKRTFGTETLTLVWKEWQASGVK